MTVTADTDFSGVEVAAITDQLLRFQLTDNSHIMLESGSRDGITRMVAYSLLNNPSYYESLKERAEKAAVAESKAAEAAESGKAKNKKTTARRSNRQGVMEAMIKSVVRAIGSSLDIIDVNMLPSEIASMSFQLAVPSNVTKGIYNTRAVFMAVAS